MKKKTLSARLKVYDYQQERYVSVLMDEKELSSFVKSTPSGYFPRIYVDKLGFVCGRHISGLNGKQDKTENYFNDAEVVYERI